MFLLDVKKNTKLPMNGRISPILLKWNFNEIINEGGLTLCQTPSIIHK